MHWGMLASLKYRKPLAINEPMGSIHLKYKITRGKDRVYGHFFPSWWIEKQQERGRSFKGDLGCNYFIQRMVDF